MEKMMMYKHIDCKYPIEIERNEIYPAIYEYILPDGYYFESQGNNYGSRIYAREITDNFYIVRKEYNDNVNDEE
jgi:hypothetical protein